MIGSADVITVGLLSQWADIGSYVLTHRIVHAVLDVWADLSAGELPGPVRSWRQATESGLSLNALIRVLMLVLIPIAFGGALLSVPLVRLAFRCGIVAMLPVARFRNSAI